MELTSILRYGALVLDRAEHLCQQVVTTRAWSRRLRGTARVLCRRPVPTIEGASGPEAARPEDAIRARIREFMTRGLLSCEDPEVIVGGLSRGGRRCVACSEPFRPGEPEYEIVSPGAVVLLLFHRRCLELYAAEAGHGGRPP
jgi:hypothetical protein